MIKSISESQDGGVSLEIQQDYGFYTAFGPEYPATNLQDSKEDGVCLHEMPWLLGSGSELQHSGAYIFRPKTPDESLQIIQPNASSGSVLIYESDLVTEVHAEFGEPSWIKQITRIISGKNYVEVEYVVGPVPINDLVGKDVVSRYSTSSIVNGGKFFSDSNGREFMMRKRGDHNVFGFDGDVDIEPVASNFYPVNAAIFVEDEAHSLSVLVDRSQGGSSLSDGSVELMIQRRGLYDDARGVGEPLDETDGGITPCRPYGFSTRLGKGVVVKGTHRLMIGKGKSGASQSRTQMDQVFSQPHVFVGSAGKGEHIPFNQANLSVLKSALPNNVMVITLAALDEDNSFLIRLGHQFDKGESEHLSSPVQVDLSDLFPGRNIVSTTEKTLSGNQNVVDWEQTRLDWSATAQKDLVGNAESVQDGSNVITLKPLEIRTFVINVL